MPEFKMMGVLSVEILSGIALPPGEGLVLTDPTGKVSLNSVLSHPDFLGHTIQLTVTVLDDGSGLRRGPGTIRDLTIPKY